jgi:serine/threonine protein kinase/Tol biopolymer transport system component
VRVRLSEGDQFGAYEIRGPLGTGAVGEVYRAHDRKLRRDVALKVLSKLLSADPDTLARFRREAHVLAALSHPNIAAIYGLEEADHHHALILELVEGPTLGERLAAGPLPIEETVAIARQLAEALDAAHEKGFVHRDLKPANIKLTPDGGVKVLDFGLAKPVPPANASETRIEETALTQGFAVMGTAAYMSPEQGRGQPVDKRTDIWAFGCVLYEMLTGRKAFAGESITDTVVEVMTKEPDWSLIPPGTPPRIVALLRRCLQKQQRDRLRDIGDAKVELDRTEPEIERSQPGPTTRRPMRRPALATIALTTAGFAAGVGLAWLLLTRPAPSATNSARTMRSAIDLPADASLPLGTRIPLIGFESSLLALSPDGTHLAYVAQSEGGTSLYIRDLATGEGRHLSGTEGAIHPFFSPDSRWLGFLTNDKVKKVAVDGGSPIALCDARIPVRATWGRDGAIYFSWDQGDLLSRVSDAGGQPVVLIGNRQPPQKTFSQMLPDGEHALFTHWQGAVSADYGEVVMRSVRTGTTKVLLRSGYDARFVPPDRLVYGRAGSLFTVRFDPSEGAVSGEPLSIASGVTMESFFGHVQVTVSENGVIAYVPGGDRAVGVPAWVDRGGTVEPLKVPPRLYGIVDLSPRGERLAVHVGDVRDYIWILDLTSDEGRRVPHPEAAGWPLWASDGRRVVFSAFAGSTPSKVFVRDVDGGDLQELFDGGGLYTQGVGWSTDGKILAISKWGTPASLVFVPSTGSQAEWKGARFDLWNGQFSPDGRWVAYSSNETGQFEIWIRSFPDGETIRQVSLDGGVEPVWLPSGELFYRQGNRWMSTQVQGGSYLQWTPPQLAFETSFIDTPGRSYDVSPDGKRLVVVRRAEADVRSKVGLIVNWMQLAER